MYVCMLVIHVTPETDHCNCTKIPSTLPGPSGISKQLKKNNDMIPVV